MLPKEKRLLKYSIILLILLSCTGTALAATYTVGNGASDDFSRINTAVLNANSGDTIIVKDGIYNEGIITVYKELTICSENGPESTVVQSSYETVFDIRSANVNITGFTIKGTDYPMYSCIYMIQTSGCNISGNQLVNSSFGINLYNASNNTIICNNMSSTFSTIYLQASNNNTLENNSVDVSSYGIYLYGSSNTTLKNNTISGNSSGIGITIDSSDNNTLTANVVSNNDMGILLSESKNNILTGNKMSLNEGNFDVYGDSLEHYIHDIDESNLVDGKPLYYWVDHRDESVPLDAGLVFIVNSTNVTVENINVSSRNTGILFAYTENSTINNVTVIDCDYGIVLDCSESITISGNNVSLNSCGIKVFSSHNNTFTNNIVGNNDDCGISFSGSANNTFKNNYLENNSNCGISLEGSGYNTLRGNAVSGSNRGIFITGRGDVGVGSLDNGIGNNLLENNDASWNYEHGIYIVESNNNTLIDNVASHNNASAVSLEPDLVKVREFAGIFIGGSANNVLIGNVANNNSGRSIIYKNLSIPDSVSPDVADDPEPGPEPDPEPVMIYSNGFDLDRCYNTTLRENTAIGNDGCDLMSFESTGAVEDLALSNTPTLSFENDASILGIYFNETNSIILTGKVNVNGYVTIRRSVPPEEYAITPSVLLPETMVFDFLYDDSGMSDSKESTIGLYIFNGTSWEAVANASLNTTANYVSANVSGLATFALFKDPEPNSGGSNPTGGDFNIRYPSQGDTSSDGESPEAPSTTTTTPLATNNNGEVTGDTVARSSDSAAAVTLHKGTVGTDSSGNPVTAITISTPASLPQGSPANGLYYDYGPSGTRFSQDVTITITFDPNDYDVNNPPEIYTYDEGTGEWVALDTTIDWEHGIATAYTNHFSLYALFGDDVVEEQASTDISEPVEEVPVEQNAGSGYLYWIIGIVILAAVAVVFVKMQKR